MQLNVPADQFSKFVLKVTGLPPGMSEIDIYKIFTPFGAVDSVTLPPPKSVSGCAFVHFRAAKDAACACTHLQGFSMQGHTLKLSLQ